MDSQAARRRSPPSGAVELSQRPYRHASDLSGGGQQFRRRGPAAKLGRAFGRRSDSLERLCRDAKLRQRPVHHCPVSLLPACFGGQLPAAVRRAAARVQKQAAGGRHLAANRTRYFRLSPHNYPHERPCRRRDRPRHVVDRSWRSRSMGDGRIHSELCPDSRARRSFFHFPIRRLAHDRLDLASPAPGGALCRHPRDGGRDGDADAPRQTIYAQSGSRYLLFRVLVLAVGCPWRDFSAPILATTKIVCDRVRPLAALGHILAG